MQTTTMAQSKPGLSAEKVLEAENKFWSICDYIFGQLYPGEKLSNWVTGMAKKQDENKDGKTNVYSAYKSAYPELDISTWKEFTVSDTEVAMEVERNLLKRGFDIGIKVQADNEYKIYVFRKESYRPDLSN